MTLRFPTRGIITAVLGMGVWASGPAQAQDSTDTEEPRSRWEDRRFRDRFGDRHQWRMLRPRVRLHPGAFDQRFVQPRIRIRDHAFGRQFDQPRIRIRDHAFGRQLDQPRIRFRGDDFDFDAPRLRGLDRSDRGEWRRDFMRDRGRMQRDFARMQRDLARTRVRWDRDRDRWRDESRDESRDEARDEASRDFRVRPMRLHRGRYHSI